MAVFATFVVEMVAFRVGAELAQKLAYDPHVGGHHHAAEHGHHHHHDTAQEATTEGRLEAQGSSDESSKEADDVEDIAELARNGDKDGLSAAASEILGVGILEFGVIFREYLHPASD